MNNKRLGISLICIGVVGTMVMIRAYGNQQYYKGRVDIRKELSSELTKLYKTIDDEIFERKYKAAMAREMEEAE